MKNIIKFDNFLNESLDSKEILVLADEIKNKEKLLDKELKKYLDDFTIENNLTISISELQKQKLILKNLENPGWFFIKSSFKTPEDMRNFVKKYNIDLFGKSVEGNENLLNDISWYGSRWCEIFTDDFIIWVVKRNPSGWNTFKQFLNYVEVKISKKVLNELKDIISANDLGLL